MAVIDASVWISRLKRDDKFHEQAKSIIETLASNQEKIKIPAIVFTEVAGVIKRTMKDNDTARDAVRWMKYMNMEVFTNFTALEPLATEIAINYGVRGADAYYLAVAELTKSKLYTFDEQQKQAFEAMYT